MNLYDFVEFINEDRRRVRGFIVGNKKIAIENTFSRDEIGLPRWCIPQKHYYIIRGLDGNVYEKEEGYVNKISVKLLNEYTTQELLDELKFRKDIDFMSHGKVCTIVQK